MEWKIGNVNIKNQVVLAPMAGVADRAFRELCVDYGAAYVAWMCAAPHNNRLCND